MTPLNWPPGTLRTLAVIGMTALVGVLLATGGVIAPTLAALTILLIGYYLGFRAADSGASPLRLPRGSIRLALTILAGYLAYRRHQAGTLFELDDSTAAIFFMVCAFLLGNAWRAAMRATLKGGGGTLATFGNHAKGLGLIASLTALLLLALLGEDAFERFTPDQVRAVLVAYIAFYFGSRSSG